jgi:hypothetical protein
MENLLRFRDAPFVPGRIAVRAVPEPGEAGYLMQGDCFSVRESMLTAPTANSFRRVERKHH